MDDNVFAAPESDGLGDELRAFMVKGVRHEGPVESGLHWATARRGRVVFHQRGLSCWSWQIPYADVETARVEWFRGAFGRSPVLLVRTRQGVSYQFGLNPGRFWSNPQLPLPIEVTDVVHGNPARAWVTRIALIGAVLYLLARIGGML